jgi:hypothetical protein
MHPVHFQGPHNYLLFLLAAVAFLLLCCTGGGDAKSAKRQIFYGLSTPTGHPKSLFSSYPSHLYPNQHQPILSHPYHTTAGTAPLYDQAVNTIYKVESKSLPPRSQFSYDQSYTPHYPSNEEVHPTPPPAVYTVSGLPRIHIREPPAKHKPLTEHHLLVSRLSGQEDYHHHQHGRYTAHPRKHIPPQHPYYPKHLPNKYAKLKYFIDVGKYGVGKVTYEHVEEESGSEEYGSEKSGSEESSSEKSSSEEYSSEESKSEESSSEKSSSEESSSEESSSEESSSEESSSEESSSDESSSEESSSEESSSEASSSEEKKKPEKLEAVDDERLSQFRRPKFEFSVTRLDEEYDVGSEDIELGDYEGVEDDVDNVGVEVDEEDVEEVADDSKTGDQEENEVDNAADNDDYAEYGVAGDANTESPEEIEVFLSDEKKSSSEPVRLSEDSASESRDSSNEVKMAIAREKLIVGIPRQLKPTTTKVSRSEHRSSKKTASDEKANSSEAAELARLSADSESESQESSEKEKRSKSKNPQPSRNRPREKGSTAAPTLVAASDSTSQESTEANSLEASEANTEATDEVEVAKEVTRGADLVADSDATDSNASESRESSEEEEVISSNRVTFGRPSRYPSRSRHGTQARRLRPFESSAKSEETKTGNSKATAEKLQVVDSSEEEQESRSDKNEEEAE